MTIPPPQEDDPMTPAQLRALYASLRMVMQSPHGEGDVRITVKNRHVRLITPSPCMDLARPEEVEKWAKRDHYEEMP